MKNLRAPPEVHGRHARLLGRVGLVAGVLILVVVAFVLVFGGAVLDGYVKGRLERAFARANPGYSLQIGRLGYAIGSNRLVARSVTLSAATSTLTVDRFSLAGVRWVRLVRGAAVADVLARAALDATNLNLELPRSRYAIRCIRLRASAPASDLIAEGTEIEPLVADEEFFAADAFRTTRFRLAVPELRVSGLAYGELLRGSSYRARSVHLASPSLDAFVNRDKPEPPFVKPPLMVHEALAAIRQPLQVGSISLTDGHLRYSERVVAGSDPGVLTFEAVTMDVEGLANRGNASAAIKLRAQGDLMNAGPLKVQMAIPLTTTDFALHYSGSLGAMDLTRLDGFLEQAEQIRIESGAAKEATFDVDVIAGQARGRLRAVYSDLNVTLLDKQTGAVKGLSSFVANALVIRRSNVPDAPAPMKEGVVSYTRRPTDTFVQFAWFALRSGVLDVIKN